MREQAGTHEIEQDSANSKYDECNNEFKDQHSLGTTLEKYVFRSSMIFHSAQGGYPKLKLYFEIPVSCFVFVSLTAQNFIILIPIYEKDAMGNLAFLVDKSLSINKRILFC